MTAKEFETTLRGYLNRKPFLSFLIDYTDGRQVWVESPHVAFAGGSATYLDGETIHFFDHTNVKALTLVTVETHS